MKSVLLLLAAPLLAAAPAQQKYTNWASDSWSVTFDSAQCWLLSEGRLDALISIGVAASDADFFISAGRPSWTSAKPGERYQARVRFGAIDRNSPALGLRNGGPGVGIIFRGSANADLVELFKASSFSVTFNGDTMALDLDRTALAELRKCVIAMGGVG